MRLTLNTLALVFLIALGWAVARPSGQQEGRDSHEAVNTTGAARCTPSHGCGCSPDTIMSGACCCAAREVEPEPDLDSCCSAEEQAAAPAWQAADAPLVVALPPQPVRNVTPIGCGCDSKETPHALPPPEQRTVMQRSEMPLLHVVTLRTQRWDAYLLPTSHVTAPRPPPPRLY